MSAASPWFNKELADALAWARKSIRRGHIVVDPDEVATSKRGARHVKTLVQKIANQDATIAQLKNAIEGLRKGQQPRFRVYTVEGI